MTIQYRFAVRRRVSADWVSLNETLLLGEFGLETDTRKLKIGDGVTAWNSLAYIPYQDQSDLLDALSVLTLPGHSGQAIVVNGAETGFDFGDLVSGATVALRPNDWYYTIIPNSGSASFWGFDPNNMTGLGANDVVNVAATNTFSRQVRINRRSSATAGNSSGRYLNSSNATLCCRAGGFKFYQCFGIADAASVAQARMACGLTSSTSVPANANPSASTDIIYVGTDSGDSNLQIIYNDSSGTASKIDLGSNFPANTRSTDWYETLFECLPGGNVDVTVRRTNTGQTTTQTLSTDIPSTSTYLGPYLWRNNGTTALAVIIADNGFVLRPNLERN